MDLISTLSTSSVPELLILGAEDTFQVVGYAERWLVHRLICSWHMVAFKMGRRQGARRAHI
jgi:hypothetical protein